MYSYNDGDIDWESLSEESMFRLLDKASSYYYNSPNLIMSDKEFDKGQAIYEKRTGKPWRVGAMAVGNTLSMSHSYKNFAGTLEKVQSLEELDEWFWKKTTDIHPYVNSEEWLLVSPKFDGFSCVVEFKYDEDLNDYYVDKAMTRGSEGVGKDLTSLVRKCLHNVPHMNAECRVIAEDAKLPYGLDYAIAYEAVISQEDFDKMLAEGYEFKNRRSAVAGAFSSKYGDNLMKYLTFIPLRIIFDGKEVARDKVSDFINNLLPDQIFEECIQGDGTIKELYEAIIDWRNGKSEESPFERDFMIDGLVVEILDEKRRKALGYTDTHPNFSVALKFPPMEAFTEIEDIEWSMEGNSTILTPVAILKPVIMNGNTYRRVSLANYGRFMRERFCKGSKVTFSLNNEVLGYVVRAEEDKEDSSPFEAPTECPVCSHKLSVVEGKSYDEEGVRVGDILLCTNPECEQVLIGSLLQFAESLRILFLDRAFATKVVQGGLYRSPIDVFNFDEDELGNVLGKGNAKRLLKQINALRESGVSVERILGGLNIPNVGKSVSKLILRKFYLSEFNDLLDESDSTIKNKLTAIEGIGEIIANNIIEARPLLKEVLTYFVEEIPLKDLKSDSPKPEVELVFCHTGTAFPFKKREELQALIEGKGHKFASGVSKKTSYLINNNVGSTSGKNAKAKELGIPIISVQDAINLLK